MQLLHSTWFVAGSIFLINLPFGFWRARTRRFSGPWFAAIHLPVFLTIGIRILAGVRFVFSSLPFFVGAFFLGQSLGGFLAKDGFLKASAPPSSEASSAEPTTTTEPPSTEA